MSKNFADFKAERPQSNEKKSAASSTNSAEQDLKKAYDELKDLDSKSLAARLSEEVKRQKNNGTFNYQMLLESVESMRMFMPQESYISLKNLLENIK